MDSSFSHAIQAVFHEICEMQAKIGDYFVLTELFEAYGVKELPCDRTIVDTQLTIIKWEGV